MEEAGETAAPLMVFIIQSGQSVAEVKYPYVILQYELLFNCEHFFLLLFYRLTAVFTVKVTSSYQGFTVCLTGVDVDALLSRLSFLLLMFMFHIMRKIFHKAEKVKTS